MSIAPGDVRDVRDGVWALVRAQTHAAVGMCGMCGRFASYVGAGAWAGVSLACVQCLSRVCACPHIPHVPHIATAASISGAMRPALIPAQAARAHARAFFPVLLALKEMEEVEHWV